MANAAVWCVWGSVTDCLFEGTVDQYGTLQNFDARGVIADDESLITGNRFYASKVDMVGFSSTVSNNEFDWCGLTIDYVWEGTVTGNRFEGYASGQQAGWHEANVRITDSSVNINISNNNFDENSAIIFGWNSYNNEFVIADNVFTASSGILMDGAWDKTSFRLEGFTITGNSMSTDWGGDSDFPPRIHLGDTDSAVFNGVIANNLITGTNTNLEAFIRIVCKQNANTGNVLITDNELRAYNQRIWAVKLFGDVAADIQTNVTVTGNDCWMTDGIFVSGYDVVDISNNKIYGDGSSYDMGFMAGQIGTSLCRTAIIKDNYVSIGDEASDFTISYGGVIAIHATYATVTGNRVVAHDGEVE